MHLPIRTPVSELSYQLLFGKCYVGPDAARAIAKKVEGEHGFWDFEERKRLAEQERQNALEPAPAVLITGGKTHRCSPPGENPAGGHRIRTGLCTRRIARELQSQ